MTSWVLGLVAATIFKLVSMFENWRQRIAGQKEEKAKSAKESVERLVNRPRTKLDIRMRLKQWKQQLHDKGQ